MIFETAVFAHSMTFAKGGSTQSGNDAYSLEISWTGRGHLRFECDFIMAVKMTHNRQREKAFAFFSFANYDAIGKGAKLQNNPKTTQ